MGSLILSAYGKRGYARYRLPSKRNVDHSIWLSDEVFHMERSLRVQMENLDGFWYIRSSEEYYPEPEGRDKSLLLSEVIKDRWRLEAGVRFEIHTVYGDVFTFSAIRSTEGILPFGKYRLQNMVTIGRSPDSDITIRRGRTVSRTHARIIYRDGSWALENYSVNGCYVNREFVEDSRILKFGDRVNIMGYYLVFLNDCLGIEAGVPDGDIRLEKLAGTGNVCGSVLPSGYGSGLEMSFTEKLVHRSPRVLASVPTDPVEIDPPPEMRESSDMSMGMSFLSNILMALPMILGSLFLIYASSKEGNGRELYMYSSLLMVSMSFVTGFIWVTVQHIESNRKQRAEEDLISSSYRAYLSEKEAEINSRYEEARRVLTSRYISVSECLDLSGKQTLLWGRASYHKDFLACRVGSGRMPLPTQIRIPAKRFRVREHVLTREIDVIRDRYETLEDVPVLLRFDQEGQIGLVASDENDRLQMLRSIIIQLAFHHCYTEVRMMVVYDGEKTCCGEDWSFMRWIPHVWSEDRDLRLIASTREEAGNLFYHLSRRLKHQEEDGGGFPVYVLFIAAPHFLEGEPVGRYLMGKEAPPGVIVIWIAEQRGSLPNACELMIENDRDFMGMCRLQTGEVHPLAFEQVGRRESDRFARQLSVYRVHEGGTGQEIPADVTFLDLFDAVDAKDLMIESFWKKNRTTDSLRAPIGLKAGGRKIYLDIHEKYHGPHGLVAGTTGSGKSELLQTYILSLTILYSPHSVNFFLIDYKGGGMSGLFDGIPHLCGQISNLSGRQTARAMTALRSENQRRQKVFQEYGVNNISAYTRLYYDDPAMEPMPHLLIIVDEFAELKKEEPEFMQELISIAQVGRSLGLHLILATQKPGGTVDDKIWSNARFRLCLKVQERQDSLDMLHKPDAADLTQTGRCCFQVGNDEIYEVFQTGWSGAGYLDRQAEEAEPDTCAELIGLDGRPETVEIRRDSSRQKLVTQFEAIRQYVMEQAAGMGIGQVRQLWMEPLPEKVLLSEIAGGERSEDDPAGGLHEGLVTSKKDIPEVIIGLADDPANQRRFPVTLSLNQHCAICGLPGTGKSTFLQTLLWGLVTGLDPEEAWIYIIDYSSGALRAYADMPQVGAVVTDDEGKKCRALFRLISALLDERKRLFQGGDYLQYIRASGEKLPLIILVLDNFTAFQAASREAFDEDLLRLLKEGESAGVILVLTCGGFSMNELPLRYSGYFKSVYCLELKDSFSYSEVFGTLSLPALPEKGVCGRGISRFDERILEFQTGLAVDGKDGYDRLNNIRQEALRKKKQWNGIKPERLKVIPDKPVLKDFLELDEVNDLIGRPKILPLGYQEESAEIAYWNMDSSCRLITGRRGSGKHNLMKLILAVAGQKEEAGQEIRICLIDLSGNLASWQDKGLFSYIKTPLEAGAFFERLARESEEQVQRSGAGIRDRYLILIEDMAGLLAGSDQADYDITGCLSYLWEKKSVNRISWVGILSGDDYMTAACSEAWPHFARDKAGIHLGGNLIEDSCFDHDSLGYEEQMTRLRPGEGYMFSGSEEARRIVIPQV